MFFPLHLLKILLFLRYNRKKLLRKGLNDVNACGLVVEYNPLHNGHVYHINAAKEKSNADVMIAVMSGSFLQRGEPAIIDKFHRAETALKVGIDIVLELPYAYSVQNSDLFAFGAIKTLEAIGVHSVCFGSESGNIDQFITSYHILTKKETDYKQILKQQLEKGLSFPQASKIAFQQVGLTDELDLCKPNNILGFSYVKTILQNNLQIKPLTIKRIEANYHDDQIEGQISSATSIRKALLKEKDFTNSIINTFPEVTKDALHNYRKETKRWHDWELYFPLLSYRVSTMTTEQLANIHDVQEGLENRLKATEKEAKSFEHWMNLLKTKRYTWTRLQRIFTHILTNTTKEEIKRIHQQGIPYIKMLGFTNKGQAFLNTRKKDFNVPLITNFHRSHIPMLQLEERASNAYYSILPPEAKRKRRNLELQGPIVIAE